MKRKKLSLGSPEPWHGRAKLCRNQPSIFQKDCTARANIGTAVRDYWVAINQDFLFFFFPHSITTTALLLKPLSKTSITTYLQTFTTIPNLHQNTKFLHPITSKHHSKYHPSTKNNFHPPKPTKFIFPLTLTQKPQILQQSPKLNSKTLLKHQPHNKINLSHPKSFQTPTFTKTQTKSTRSMAAKRQGKEIASSSGGGSRKQAAPRNHDITFSTPEQRSRYKSLISKPLHASRYLDNYDMDRLGIIDNVIMMLNRLGWVELLRPMKGFENFAYEFLSFIAFTKDRMNFDNPDHRVSFRLMNIDYEMSLDSFDHDLRPKDYNPATF